MDIATPPQPDGTIALADAAPMPHDPPVIRREDYAPFPWLIDRVVLDFELGLETTRVTSDFSITRNPAAQASNTIRLNGDGLMPLSVEVDLVPVKDWEMDGGDLILTLPGDHHAISIVTEINPAANTQLMGLYASNGMLCTQCEAEGFRRITFFPDRPDVLAVYTVRMTGSQALFPIMLTNGNPIDQRDLGNGRHFAEWTDPWPKPSYLFALVAGNLVANRGNFTTASGREVECNIWVRPDDLARTDHALESLHRSMAWDEQVFGREYDLDLYNVVAVSDFNMGAMENKGLNVFNTKYVLADRETATDADYDAIEGVIAHEYFHNWSGNRVTCRDWFQLSLKEGFTVLRDQLFSQDMQGEAVKRIEDVRILRQVQFPEDSGPLAHPIRPDSFREISNFYTATVYNKGAEVIRMMRTLAGEQAFRAGCDLYFDRHDGQAATCEDFIRAMEDGARLDLTRFRRWYSQAGTPKVDVQLRHRGDTATLHLAQSLPPTPGQRDKAPMPIPLRLALFDRASGQHRGEQLVVLDQPEMTVEFDGYTDPPVVSINRGFSAPVAIERTVSDADLQFLAAHDDDPFARYEAMQELMVGYLTDASGGGLADSARGARRAVIRDVFAAVLDDTSLDDAMRAELLTLPGQAYLAEQQLVADPARIHAEREGLKAWLGSELDAKLAAAHVRTAAVPFALDAAAKGARKLRTLTLAYLAAGKPDLAVQLAAEQYDRADNMTDRQGALMVLTALDSPQRTACLLDFYNRFRGNELVIDKWFSLQAMSLHPHVLEHVKALARHPDFTLHNPNRVRALYMAFTAAPQAFHVASGEGYRLLADLILALDPTNPQTAARFVPLLGRWRRIEPGRAALMRAELERILAHRDDQGGLSRDTFEQVSRSLG